MKTYSVKANVWNSGNLSVYYYAGNGKFRGVDMRKQYYSKEKAESVVEMLRSKEYAADKVEFEITEDEIGIDDCAQHINRLLGALKSDKRLGKRIRTDSWVSGSGEVVTPITIWGIPAHQIRVQLKSTDNFPVKTMRKFKETFDGLVANISLNVNDGSCPNELVIYIRK